MIRATPADLPETSMLRSLRRRGSHVDCFALTVPLAVTQAQYIAAFYTTRLFKAERWVLKWLMRRPSTDTEALELAYGGRDAFAAWRVTRRTDDQMLLTDVTGRTASWLMAAPSALAGTESTQLYFGSALRPRGVTPDGVAVDRPGFRALLWLHELYSRLLLQAAASSLMAHPRPRHRR